MLRYQNIGFTLATNTPFCFRFLICVYVHMHSKHYLNLYRSYLSYLTAPLIGSRIL